MAHDTPSTAGPVGMTGHTVLVRNPRSSGVLAPHGSAARTWRVCPRVLVILLGLVLTSPPPVAEGQVAAHPVVGGIFDPHGVPSNRANRRDATVLTLERLIDGDRLDEARAKLREEFDRHGELPRLIFLEAMILYKERQYLQSARRLERSLTSSDRDPDVYKLAGLNLLSLGRRDLAGPYFETAVDLAPRDFMARYYLGLHELSDRRYDRAESILREVITLSPDYVDAHILLGVAEEQRGNEEKAIRTYRHAIELAERQRLKRDAPFLYLGRLLISLHRHEESLTPLGRAVELDSGSSQARALLGQALTHLGRYDEALPVLRAAVTLGPEDKTGHYLLMTVYKRLGRRDEAAREMQRFLALDQRDRGNSAPDDSDKSDRRRNDVH